MKELKSKDMKLKFMEVLLDFKGESKVKGVNEFEGF